MKGKNGNVYFIFILLFLSVILYFTACSSNNNDSSSPSSPPNSDISYTYSGSGTQGDVISITINNTQQTFSGINETTSQNFSGNFSIIGNTLFDGKLIEYNVGGNSYYGAQLDDNYFVTSFLANNNNNLLSFLITANTNNTGKESTLIGDYVFLEFSNSPVNGSNLIKEWGFATLEISPNEVRIKRYATSSGDNSIPPADPYQPATYGNVTYVAAGTEDISGSWWIDTTNKERVNFLFDGDPNTYTGFALIKGSDVVCVIDKGQGNGFIFGLKIPSSQVSIPYMAGDYYGIVVSNTLNITAVKYSINSSGAVAYTTIDMSGNTTSGSISTPPSICGPINNIYLYQNVDIQGVSTNIYVFFGNNMMGELSLDPSTGLFFNYGIAVKK